MRTVVIAAASLAGAVSAVVVAGVIAATTEAVSDDEAWRRVFDSLLTLAVALVLTGCLGVAIDATNRAREDREHDLASRLTLAERIRAVHSEVKRAALLIDAHRSARTYGEQMRALIETRVNVGNIRFAIRHAAGLDEPSRSQVINRLDVVTEYLQDLTGEYRTQYPRVSAIQGATHEWEIAQARKLATGQNPPSPVDIAISSVPWDQLTDREAFPRLAVLLDSLGTSEDVAPHQEHLSDPLEDAVRQILATHR